MITKGNKNNCHKKGIKGPQRHPKAPKTDAKWQEKNTKQAEHNFKWQKRCKTIREAQKPPTHHISLQNNPKLRKNDQNSPNKHKMLQNEWKEAQINYKPLEKCTKHSI